MPRRPLTRRPELLLALGIAVAAAVVLGGWLTPVRFEQQRIEVAVRLGGLHVAGLYLYASTSRLLALLTLHVPFPVDVQHAHPHEVAGAEADERMTIWHPLTRFPREDGWAFRLLFAPGERKWVRLEYAQEAREPSGRYILTTTWAWGRPLAAADFEVSVPAGFDLAWSSYALDRRPAPAGERRFGFSRRDFLPDGDWVFGWRGETAG